MSDCYYANNLGAYQESGQMYPGEKECDYPETGELKFDINEYDSCDMGCPGYKGTDEKLTEFMDEQDFGEE
jgi:hypothetical protein